MTNTEKSILLLQKLETKEIFNLGFSGGKDSVVILDLASISIDVISGGFPCQP